MIGELAIALALCHDQHHVAFDCGPEALPIPAMYLPEPVFRCVMERGYWPDPLVGDRPFSVTVPVYVLDECRA
jgi:hypothetical protein